MIDIVYITDHHCNDNGELLHSLRSVQKYMQNFRNIYIVGEYGNFDLQFSEKLRYIPWGVKFPKNAAITSCLLRACDQRDITTEFVFMADDIYLLQPVDARNLPFYIDPVNTKLENDVTHAALAEKNYSVIQYTQHVPLRIHTTHFKYAMHLFPWMNIDFDQRQAYPNIMKFSGPPMEDLKLTTDEHLRDIRKTIDGRTFFSSYPLNFKHSNLSEVLQELYTEKFFGEK